MGYSYDKFVLGFISIIKIPIIKKFGDNSYNKFDSRFILIIKDWMINLWMIDLFH